MAPDHLDPHRASQSSSSARARRAHPGREPVTPEWLAAQMDPVAFDLRIEPQNVGQSWDRQQRQRIALDHAQVAIRLLASRNADTRR
jgi:hypothetical protein